MGTQVSSVRSGCYYKITEEANKAPSNKRIMNWNLTSMDVTLTYQGRELKGRVTCVHKNPDKELTVLTLESPILGKIDIPKNQITKFSATFLSNPIPLETTYMPILMVEKFLEQGSCPPPISRIAHWKSKEFKVELTTEETLFRGRILEVTRCDSPRPSLFVRGEKIGIYVEDIVYYAVNYQVVSDLPLRLNPSVKRQGVIRTTTLLVREQISHQLAGNIKVEVCTKRLLETIPYIAELAKVEGAEINLANILTVQELETLIDLVDGKIKIRQRNALSLLPIVCKMKMFTLECECKQKALSHFVKHGTREDFYKMQTSNDEHLKEFSKRIARTLTSKILNKRTHVDSYLFHLNSNIITANDPEDLTAHSSITSLSFNHHQNIALGFQGILEVLRLSTMFGAKIGTLQITDVTEGLPGLLDALSKYNIKELQICCFNTSGLFFREIRDAFTSLVKFQTLESFKYACSLYDSESNNPLVNSKLSEEINKSRQEQKINTVITISTI